MGDLYGILILAGWAVFLAAAWRSMKAFESIAESMRKRDERDAGR